MNLLELRMQKVLKKALSKGVVTNGQYRMFMGGHNRLCLDRGQMLALFEVIMSEELAQKPARKLTLECVTSQLSMLSRFKRISKETGISQTTLWRMCSGTSKTLDFEKLVTLRDAGYLIF